MRVIGLCMCVRRGGWKGGEEGEGEVIVCVRERGMRVCFLGDEGGWRRKGWRGGIVDGTETAEITLT